MGGTNSPGRRILLPRAPRDIFQESSTVFRWAREDWDDSHRGTGYPGDYGLAQVCPWIASVLHIWEHVPRKRGCANRPTGCACLSAIARGDYRRKGVP